MIEPNVTMVVARKFEREYKKVPFAKYDRFASGHRNFDSDTLAVKFIVDSEESSWFINPDYAQTQFKTVYGFKMPAEFLPELLITNYKNYDVFDKFEYFLVNKNYEIDNDEPLKTLEEFLSVIEDL